MFLRTIQYKMSSTRLRISVMDSIASRNTVWSDGKPSGAGLSWNW